MGVAGAGKTTVARRVARELGWQFLDADDLHSEASREKIRAGTGLGDIDRLPWLQAVREVITVALERGQSISVACSALRRSHREILKGERPDEVRFVWLDVPRHVLRSRLTERSGHFAGPDILESQLEALEPPAEEKVHRVPAGGGVEAVVEQVVVVALQ